MALPISLPSLAAGVALLVVGLYKLVLYPVFLSPLSSIPNAHPTSPLSPIWVYWKRYQKQENRTINAAHERYGPVVRLGPNELSVNMVDGGIRSIYSGGYEKGSWYDIFDNYGVPCMFSTAEHKPHSNRKRMISNVYSKSSIQNSQHMHDVATSVLYERFFPLISKQLSKPVEVHSLLNAVTMDMMNGFMFGLCNGSNFNQDDKARRRFLELYHSRRKYIFFQQELPGLVAFTQKLGLPIIPKWVGEATAELDAWCMSMCDAAERTLSRKSTEGKLAPADEPAVYEQLRNQLEKEKSRPIEKGAAPPDSQLYDLRTLRASEMFDQLAAGHETSAIGMTYLMYYLSGNPQTQQHLRRELNSLSLPLVYPPSNPTDLPSPKELDALPFLHAVVMETLRVNPPIPGPQPRKTPPDACLGGYEHLPAGIRVSALPYSLHRNAEVFPYPEAWRPERWLCPVEQNEGEQSYNGLGAQERSRWWWAFGSGGRMCIGSNFAVHEMKLLTAAIYTNFETTIVDDSGIEQEDAYIARPSGAQLTLKFDRLAHAGV